ncbi:hypothetical protein OPQ81_007585 [Rhizoctonia solani]|nr:hypothetical protein OPQ81_007585 [Rhizoctonia solani]
MEYRPEILWQREDHIRLGQLHSYLIGDNAESRNLPLAFHQVLEKHGNLLLTHLDQFKADLLTQVEKFFMDTLAHLQANQHPSPHTPPRAEPQSVKIHPKLLLAHSTPTIWTSSSQLNQEKNQREKANLLKGNPLQPISSPQAKTNKDSS